MGDLGATGALYQGRLKQFNDGLNNTTLAVNQFASAFRDAQRVARDATASAQEKKDAERKAFLSQVSGFGSGIEGFANSYTNGVDHLNEVRHGFVRRNFMAKNTKALAQQLQDVRSAIGSKGEIDPRTAAANRLTGRISQPLQEVGEAVEHTASDVGEGGSSLPPISARLQNLADEATAADPAAAGASIRQRLLQGAQDLRDQLSSMNNSLGNGSDPEEATKTIAKETAELGDEPSVDIGSKASAIGKETEDVVKGLDDALPEVDAAEATTAEIPVVGEAVGAVGGLIQLGSALADAFGGEDTSKPVAPKVDTAGDGEQLTFAPGQVGGDFAVSRSTA